MILDFVFENDKPSLTLSLYNDGAKSATDVINIPVADYDNNIQEKAKYISNSMLPPAVRYIDYSRGVVLFERPPTYVSFNFTPNHQLKLKADGNSQLSISLPIPWQRYVAFFGPTGLPYHLFLFFANKQIQSLDNDPMSYAPMPNLYTDARVCLPLYSHVEDMRFNLVEAISNAYDTIWKSGFNVDVMQSFAMWRDKVDRRRNPIANVDPSNYNKFYKHWATYSLDDIVAMDWNAIAYNSFNQLLENVQSGIDIHDSVVDLYLAAR